MAVTTNPRDSGDPRHTGFADVLTASSGGDGQAFEQLVNPLLPRLRGYLRAQAGDESDDLLGDVLLRVFGALGSFTGSEEQFRSWVFTIAHHRVVDARRRRRRHEPLERTAWRIPGGDSEEEAVSSLAAGELRRVLRLLAPAQRQVLLLRIVADLSVEQTAGILGKSPGAVKVLQHRALESVRKKIRKDA